MKIRSKFFFSLFPVALVALALSAWFNYRTMQSAMSQQVLNQLQSVAAIQAHRLQAIRAQNLERLKLVASRTQLRLSLARFLKRQDPLDQSKMNRILRDAAASITPFRTIDILSLNDHIVASTESERLGRSITLAASETSLTTPHVDGFFLDPAGQVMLRLVGPLQLKGEVLGRIAIEADLQNMRDVVEDLSGLGQTGEIQLARREQGGEALFLLPLRSAPTAALKLRLPLDSGHPMHQALDGKQLRLADAKDRQGDAVLAATHYLPKAQWGVVVKIDQAEALAAMQGIARELWLSLLLMGLALLLLSGWLGRHLTAPVEALASVVHHVRQGRLDVQADVRSGDEIGELARDFNQMVVTLRSSHAQLQSRMDAHKQTAAELKRWAQIFEHAEWGIAVSQAESPILETINPAYARMHGFTVDELKGYPIIDLYTPAEREGFPQWMAKVQEQEHISYETRHLRKDGSEFPVLIDLTLIRDPDGNKLFRVANVQDITQPKSLEESLRRSEERFRALMESTVDCIWEMDAEANFSYVSPRIEELLGYTPDEVVGKLSGFDLMPLEEADRVRKVFKALVATGEPFTALVNINQHKDGHLVIMESSGRPFFDESGKLLGYRGIDRDITERKRIEEDLIRTKIDAEEANLAKSEFLATMSHEIRTPMNLIMGMGELLMEGPLDEEQKRQVSLSQRAGETLLDLINDILDISRIEAGQMEVVNEPFNPQEVVLETVEIMQVRVQERLLMLKAEIDETVPLWVMGDARRVRQVLINILGNAVKFTDQGTITVTLEADTQWWRCYVKDTGLGIAPENLEQIFNKFTQVDSSLIRRYGGTGLGLAITRHLMQLMGGDVHVESVLGQGSLFTLRWPIGELPAQFVPQQAEVATEVSAQEDQGERVSQQPLSILAVDDAEDNLQLLRAYLKQQPHDLVTVQDGQAALTAVQQEPYDLILMDIQMPVMDGYAATQEIRRLEQVLGRTPCKIVALTAHALKSDYAKSIAAGCDEHLTKPLKKKTLLAWIEQFIASHQERAQ
uniref:histidine kinase n=1 Tax=Magnetococcus massalia (strain MO-1) TaxID=451514 RepID=A0A1S7LE44_MAGMO|nr:putative Histidine kinase with HAMP domain, PAS 3 domain, PAS 4 domain, HisKA domain, HATPase_c domain and response reg domain [Candidatus Magnetococcus massalia]